MKQRYEYTEAARVGQIEKALLRKARRKAKKAAK